MKKNKIFSFILSLATICNFTLAQAQDNNEKDLKNTIVLANKDKDVEKYEADKLLHCFYSQWKNLIYGNKR